MSGVRWRYLARGAVFALALAATVVWLEGWPEERSTLAVQMLLIAVPSVLPFAFLGAAQVKSVWISTAVAMLLIIGWSYVVYMDTIGYRGGGATFSLLFGWASCLASFMLAVILAIASDARHRRKTGDDRHPNVKSSRLVP